MDVLPGLSLNGLYASHVMATLWMRLKTVSGSNKPIGDNLMCWYMRYDISTRTWPQAGASASWIRLHWNTILTWHGWISRSGLRARVIPLMDGFAWRICTISVRMFRSRVSVAVDRKGPWLAWSWSLSSHVSLLPAVGSGLEVDELVSVTIDYLDGTSFLLCCSYRHMFPLGLCQYLEDQYVFSLGPQHFSLASFPQDVPTPVLLLLFPSWVE